MDFEIKQQDEKSIIILNNNNVVGPEAASFQNALLDLIEKDTKAIEVDLSRINYITSYGIGMLVYGHTTCTKRNIQFSVVEVNAKVQELLRIVHLDKIFNLTESTSA